MCFPPHLAELVQDTVAGMSVVCQSVLSLKYLCHTYNPIFTVPTPQECELNNHVRQDTIEEV